MTPNSYQTLRVVPPADHCGDNYTASVVLVNHLLHLPETPDPEQLGTGLLATEISK